MLPLARGRVAALFLERVDAGCDGLQLLPQIGQFVAARCLLCVKRYGQKNRR